MDNVILVTGATGTVGREVVHHLLQTGQHVRVLVHEPRTLAPAFDGVRKAFVLAAFPGPDMEKMEINAFVAAEQAGVGHIVYLSNFGAGRFDGELWTGHGANEWRLRTLTSTWTILRPTRFMSSLPFVWTSGSTTADCSNRTAGARSS